MSGPARDLFDRLDLVVKVLGLAVAALAAWQYVEDRHAARVERALDVFRSAEEGRILEARERLAEAIRPLVDEAGEALAAGTPVEEAAATLDSLTHDLIADRLRIEADYVLAYFERARLCVAAGACDASTMRGLLQAEARLTYLTLDGWLARKIEEERGSRNPDFALGLRCFAGMLTNTWRCFGTG